MQNGLFFKVNITHKQWQIQIFKMLSEVLQCPRENKLHQLDCHLSKLCTLVKEGGKI